MRACPPGSTYIQQLRHSFPTQDNSDTTIKHFLRLAHSSSWSPPSSSSWFWPPMSRLPQWHQPLNLLQHNGSLLISRPPLIGMASTRRPTKTQPTGTLPTMLFLLLRGNLQTLTSISCRGLASKVHALTIAQHLTWFTLSLLCLLMETLL